VYEGIIPFVPLVAFRPLIPVGIDGIFQLKFVFGVGDVILTELVAVFEQTTWGVP
jgi:hypothetical protein